jgi:hypothetical protein
MGYLTILLCQKIKALTNIIMSMKLNDFVDTIYILNYLVLILFVMVLLLSFLISGIILLILIIVFNIPLILLFLLAFPTYRKMLKNSFNL